MPKVGDSPREFKDAIFSFPKGVDMNIDPLLLPKDQLNSANNATTRGDFVGPRPSINALAAPLAIGATPLNGLFQDACYYKPDSGPECLMAAVAGHLYQIQINGSVVTMTDVTNLVPGGPSPPATGA